MDQWQHWSRIHIAEFNNLGRFSLRSKPSSADELTRAYAAEMSYIIEFLLHESSLKATFDLLLYMAMSLYAIIVHKYMYTAIIYNYTDVCGCTVHVSACINVIACLPSPECTPLAIVCLPVWCTPFLQGAPHVVPPRRDQ